MTLFCGVTSLQREAFNKVVFKKKQRMLHSFAFQKCTEAKMWKHAAMVSSVFLGYFGFLRLTSCYAWWKNNISFNFHPSSFLSSSPFFLTTLSSSSACEDILLEKCYTKKHSSNRIDIHDLSEKEDQRPLKKILNAHYPLWAYFLQHQKT